MRCEYCIPNRRGNRKALLVNTQHCDGNQTTDYIQVTKSNKKSKKHVLESHRVRKDQYGMKRRSKKHSIEINFCPVCGRDLSEKLELYNLEKTEEFE